MSSESASSGLLRKGSKKSAVVGTTSNTTDSATTTASKSYAANLVRDHRQPGLKPRFLLSGFYGERIKHVVHDGALQLPIDALETIMEQTLPRDHVLAAASRKYELPGLDSVIRPCGDPSLDSIVVTELTNVLVNPPPIQQQQAGSEYLNPIEPTFKTVAVNRVLHLSKPKPTIYLETTERIRGGGTETSSEDLPSENRPTSPTQMAQPNTDTPIAPIGSNTAIPTLTTPTATETSYIDFQPAPVASGISSKSAESSNATPLELIEKETPKDRVEQSTTRGNTATRPDTLDPASVTPLNLSVGQPDVPLASRTLTHPMISSSPNIETIASPTEESNTAAMSAAPVAVESASETLKLPSSNPILPLSASAAASNAPSFASAPSVVPPTIASAGPSILSAATPYTAITVPTSTSTSVGIAEATMNLRDPKSNSVAISIATANPSTVAAPSTVASYTPVPPLTAALPSGVSGQTSQSTTINTAVSVKTSKPSNESSLIPSIDKSVQLTLVQPLQTKPEPQWVQLVSEPNDEVVDPKTPRPTWYRADSVSSFERTMLPEWFDGSAPHRTPESYRETREEIINMSDRLGNRNVTATLVRRSIVGDAGSLIRLHGFLNNFGFINEDAINDTTPTGSGLRHEGSALLPDKERILWDERKRDDLLEAVVEQANRKKRPKLSMDEIVAEEPFVPIDWDEVAGKVGNGASSLDCEREFLSMPIQQPSATGGTPGERSITPDITMSEPKDQTSTTETDTLKSSRELIFREIVEQTNPEILRVVTDAALRATNNSDFSEAQRAAIAGLFASQAAKQARSEEDAMARILSGLVEQRMQKIENRMALMDDLEEILEAERMCLELERRDLYTARCRHWFGGT